MKWWLLLALTLATGCAQGTERESVTIRAFATACVGKCPDYWITISEGQVTGFYNLWVGESGQRLSLSISGAAFDKFRSVLRPLRPKGAQISEGKCPQIGQGITEIQWSGGGPDAYVQLICAGEDPARNMCALERALAAIGLDALATPHPGKVNDELLVAEGVCPPGTR